MIDLENKEIMLFFNCAQSNQLRYMVIGGYAVNYYGYHRHTLDLDIWLAPTNRNKIALINTFHCMGFSESETESLKTEDFTQHFKCTVGDPPDVIDLLTIIHEDIEYDIAEKEMTVFKINPTTSINLIGFDTLADAKTKSTRYKDWEDIARLRDIRAKKK